MSEPALLGKGLVVRGRVHGEGDLRVAASIQGDLVVGGALEIASGATVTGGVEASSLIVAGELEGDIDASGAVTITETGKVHGDIKTSELSLEEGGSFVGRVEADFDLPEEIA